MEIGDWSGKIGDWTLGARRFFLFEARSRGPPARIPRGTPRRDMQLFEYRSVRYWSQEIDTTLTGGRKKLIFLIRDIDVPHHDGRVDGIPSIRDPEVSLGSLRVVLYMVSRLHRMRRRFEGLSANWADHWSEEARRFPPLPLRRSRVEDVLVNLTMSRRP